MDANKMQHQCWQEKKSKHQMQRHWLMQHLLLVQKMLGEAAGISSSEPALFFQGEWWAMDGDISILP